MFVATVAVTVAVAAQKGLEERAHLPFVLVEVRCGDLIQWVYAADRLVDRHKRRRNLYTLYTPPPSVPLFSLVSLFSP
jgi:hypothetical protein